MVESKNRLNVVQLNFHRRIETHAELSHYAIENSCDIILSQEPYTNKKNEPASIRGFVPFCHSKFTSRIKSIVYVHQTQNALTTLMAQWTDENFVVLKLKMKSDDLILINAYVEPGEPGEETWSRLENLMQTLSHKNLILCGDLNGRHTMWGDRVVNDRGIKVLDLITSFGLEIANTGSNPTFVSNGKRSLRSSIIDLTLISMESNLDIIDWNLQGNITTLSDHVPITFTIGKFEAQPKARTSTYKYSVDPAKWEIFDQHLKRELENRFPVDNSVEIQESRSSDLESRPQPVSYESFLYSTEGIDRLVELIEKCIEKASIQAFKKHRNKYDKCEWWTDELATLKRKVRAQKAKMAWLSRRSSTRRTSLMEWSREIQLSQELKSTYANSLREAAYKSLNNMIEKASTDNAHEINRRILKYNRKQNYATTMLFGNEYSHGEYDTMERAAAHFFVRDDEEYSDYESDLHVLDSHLEDDPPFTMEEMLEEAKKANPSKAPGVDGFTADIVARAVKLHSKLFLDLFNACLQLSHFPKRWKVAICKLIPKAGKDNYSDIKSWRPIGLLTLLGKLLEAMIINRINYKLAIDSSLSDQQFGFREQTSTVDALHRVIDEIRRRAEREQVMLISLDIQGAFDHAKWPIIHQRLMEYNIPENLRKITRSYLADREVWLPVSDGYVKVETNQGCIQGAKSAPSLWTVLMNSIFYAGIESKKVKLFAFADDLNMVISGKDPSTAIKIANRALSRAFEWGKKNGLTFNAAKTKYMPCTAKLKHFRYTPGSGALSLPREKKIKILGVTIDSRLKFNHHVSEVIEKAERTYKAIGRISRRTWGSSSQVLRKIYLTAIEPMVTYACSLWRDALKLKYVQVKLKRFQRSFLKAITRSYNSVSYEALCVIANVKPISLRIMELAENDNVRRTKEALIPHSVQVVAKLEEKDLVHPAKRHGITFDMIETQRDLESKISSDQLIIFTDGSKHDDHVGAAWLTTLQHGREKLRSGEYKLANECSVYQAELLAIEQALEQSDALLGHGKNIHLCSDSLSSLMSLEDRNSRFPLVNSIQRTLTHLQQQEFDVHLYWVRGHNGIIGNDAVDELAKRAADADAESIVYNQVPFSTVKLYWRKKTEEIWFDDYLFSQNASHTKLFIKNLDEMNDWSLYGDTNFWTTQALTGHGCSRDYLMKRKKTNDNRCFCGEIQTMEHLLLCCDVFAARREAFYAKIETTKPINERVMIFSDFAVKIVQDTQKLNHITFDSEPT